MEITDQPVEKSVKNDPVSQEPVVGHVVVLRMPEPNRVESKVNEPKGEESQSSAILVFTSKREECRSAEVLFHGTLV